MVRLPPGCDFDRSELTAHEGRICRIFYDEEGTEIHRVYGSTVKPISTTGIRIDQRKDPSGYHREYYRRIRRVRDRRKTRGPYKPNT